MTRVLQFPEQECIAVDHGINVETGRDVYFIELVTADGRSIVGEYSSMVDLAWATLAWEEDGVPLRLPIGGEQ